MTTPPLLVRRLVLTPVVLAADVAVLVLSPVLGLLAALASPLAGGLRPLRALGMALDFCLRHLACTVACFGLWVAWGFGRRADSPRSERAHYAVLRWFVAGLHRSVLRCTRVEVRVVESEEAEEVLSSAHRPVIALSRHAGEGDSLLVLHELLCRHGRLVRLVLHEALRLDPLIDVLGRRLPNRFVDPRGGDTEVEIAALARHLESDDALLIFPEGGNFSDARRTRGIAWLERAGHAEEAAWARGMEHVVAPRPGGALAALDAAPHADVVFVAHVGVPVGAGDLWRRLAEPLVVELRVWLVPAHDVPDDRDEQIDWLFGWWRTIDAWVAQRHAA